MDTDLLGAEDYASVYRAMRVSPGRRGTGRTLNGHFEGSAQFIAEIEDGFDTASAFEYSHDLRVRDWLHDAWPILTERVRRIRQGELDALDARYRAATRRPSESSSEGAWWSQEGRWWHGRSPLLVSGDPTEPLPKAWSPTPSYI